MAVEIGYLLPTRENVMQGRHEAAPLLALAEQAEALGYRSIWIGDSLLARPRHDPFTLMAAVAARTKKPLVGTAVLLPALRNPVVLAHMAATIDQIAEGRLVLGVGIASDVPNVRDEFEAAGVPFEKRLGRMMEGLRLCRALWSGEEVNWEGRWTVRRGVLGPLPHRKGGPLLWNAGSAEPTIERVGKFFDGWFPNGPSPALFGERFAAMKQVARQAGRDPAQLAACAYLTLAVDDDEARANRRMDDFMGQYYGERPDSMRKRQACFAGTLEGARQWLGAYAAAGATHMCLRFAGDHERHLEMMAGIADRL